MPCVLLLTTAPRKTIGNLINVLFLLNTFYTQLLHLEGMGNPGEPDPDPTEPDPIEPATP